MKIYIPSYKRAGKVKTRETLGTGILAVHEFEAEDYEMKEGGEMLILPDSLKGNIAKVRNFILDSANDDDVVMMDDDISNIGFHEKLQQNKMSPDKIKQFLDNGYKMAKELNVSLWGTS